MNMLKQTALCFVILFVANSSFAQEYAKARILIEDLNFDALRDLGIALDHVDFDLDYVEGDFSYHEIEEARAAGFKVDIMVEDAEAHYASKRTAVLTKRSNAECLASLQTFGISTPENFHLGSYQGNFTLTEALLEFDKMQTLYPDLISQRQPIEGYQTHEGRPIEWIRISDHPDLDEDEPEILYTALHHAREPVSLTQLIYFMWYLLENAEKNEEIDFLVKNTELYFIPIVNPDGYVYNEMKHPTGGGLWRKNRRPNADGSYGVDLNRNYGHKWGFSNEGSSDKMHSEVYRGTSAFSEPETQAVRDFVRSHQFKIALNYHSWGGFLIYPWGYTSVPTQDVEIFKELGLLLTKDNRYVYGTGLETVNYSTNGDADDWMYGEVENKNKIFAMTPEIGTREHGFWPAKEDVEHLCKAALTQNLNAASFLLNSALVIDESDGFITEKTGGIPYRLTKLGFEDVGLNLSFKPITDNITFTTPSKLFILSLFTRQRDQLDYILDSDIQDGERIRFSYRLDNGSYVQQDTITIYYRDPDFALHNDGSIDDWSSEGLTNSWGETDKVFYSAPTSLTDSPNGNYIPYSKNYLVTKDPIQLLGKDSVILTFKAYWDIQRKYDYLQVEVSPDGVFYEPLCGNYSSSGVTPEVEGQAIYSGRQLDWITERIDLSPFLGESVYLRFAMESTSNDTRDGFYLDDLRILQYDQGSITRSDWLDESAFSLSIYPNPVQDQLNLELTGELNQGDIVIYNQLGQPHYQIPASAKLSIVTDDWSPGIYYLQIIDVEGRRSTARKFVLH